MRLNVPFVLTTSLLVGASLLACSSDDSTTPTPAPDGGGIDAAGGSDAGSPDSTVGNQDAGSDAKADTNAPVDGSGDAVTDAGTDGSTSLKGISHVLLLSIDGLHEQDLANFIAANPSSTLAGLAGHGLQYTSAYVNRLDGTPTNPSDSFPGLLALVTGASSKTHGGWYDVSWARDLYPAPSKSGTDAGSPCTGPLGAEAAYDESIEADNSHLWGSATDDHPTHDINVVRSRISTANLPWAGPSSTHCQPVYAHDYIRVNTIFNVAHAAGLHTAWSDKHLAYEMVSGPSGDGLDDFFAPEINSSATNLPGTGSDAGAGEDFTS